MKKTRMLQILLTVSLMLQLLSLPAYGYWKVKMAISERNAAEYISQLKAGARPDDLTRPEMRYDEEYNAKMYVKELNRAMDEAERLARQGRNDQIEELELQFRLPEEKEY